MNNVFDCIIIGAGPAGLAAALYASRDGLNVLVLEKFFPGGQINNTDRIENYPAIEQIDGPSLIANMQKQAVSFGTKIMTGCQVTSLKQLPDCNIEITSNDKDKFIARAVIIAIGSDYKKIGIPGEAEFRSAGTGVSYCGTCDAPFFRGKEVFAIGGGNTAIEEALHLAKFASKVTLIHRRDEFRATKVLQDELFAKVAEPDSNLSVKLSTLPLAIEGKGKVQSIKLENLTERKIESYPCDGVFIFAGMVPNTSFLNGFVDMTQRGYIICDSDRFRTNVPGVFAAGDCRVGAAMQLITAVNDGVVSAINLKQYFRDCHWWHKTIKDEMQSGGW